MRRERERERERETEPETEPETDRETDKDKDRDRQSDRQRERGRDFIRLKFRDIHLDQFRCACCIDIQYNHHIQTNHATQPTEGYCCIYHTVDIILAAGKFNKCFFSPQSHLYFHP